MRRVSHLLALAGAIVRARRMDDAKLLLVFRGVPRYAADIERDGRGVARVLAPYFCANPECVLHVRADDPNVCGHGPWALRPDGVWVGQTARGGAMYCDLCVRAKNLVRADDERRAQ